MRSIPRTSFQIAKIEPFHDAEHVVLVDEAHLDVDLRELGLAIEAQVFVTEAFDDLKVFVEARDHVELLEELRALREREEFPRAHAARHEEVSGAARRVLHHHRRLELEEAVFVEIASRDLVGLVADAERALERRAAEVEVAILEAFFLRGVEVVLDLEGRGVGLVEDRELDRVDLDLAGRQARVHVRAAAEDRAADADDPLGSERLREVMRLLREIAVARELRVEDDLRDALTVAQIDEDAAAMVAVARHPSEQDDFLAGVRCAQGAVVMRAFELVDESGHGLGDGNLPPFRTLGICAMNWARGRSMR